MSSIVTYARNRKSRKSDRLMTTATKGFMPFVPHVTSIQLAAQMAFINTSTPRFEHLHSWEQANIKIQPSDIHAKSTSHMTESNQTFSVVELIADAFSNALLVSSKLFCEVSGSQRMPHTRPIDAIAKKNQKVPHGCKLSSSNMVGTALESISLVNKQTRWKRNLESSPWLVQTCWHNEHTWGDLFPRCVLLREESQHWLNIGRNSTRKHNRPLWRTGQPRNPSLPSANCRTMAYQLHPRPSWRLQCRPKQKSEG